MKAPNSLTDGELKQYADEHLRYEIDMLTCSAGILTYLKDYGDKGYLPWAINNGILNTFTLHARNLISFLYSRTLKRDFPSDIILEDYVEESLIAKYLPSIDPLLMEALEKASKQVAHLTMERIEYEQSGKEWKFIEISKSIRKAFAAIAPHFSDSKISEELKQMLSNGEVRIPVIDIKLKVAPNEKQTGICFSFRLSESGDQIIGIQV